MYNINQFFMLLIKINSLKQFFLKGSFFWLLFLSINCAFAVSNQTITIRLVDENGNILANYPSDATRMTWQYRCGGSWVYSPSSGQQTNSNGEFDVAINCSSNNWDGNFTINLFNTSQELAFNGNPITFTTAKVNVNIKNSCSGLITSPGSDIQVNYSGWPSMGNTNGVGSVSWQAFAGKLQTVRLGNFNRVSSIVKTKTLITGVNDIDFLTSTLSIYGATSRYPNNNSSHSFSTPSEFIQGTYPVHLYTGSTYRGIHNINVSGCQTTYYPLLSSNSGVTITQNEGLYNEDGIVVIKDAVDKTWQVTPSSNLSNVSLTFQWDGSSELNGFDETLMGVYSRATGFSGSGAWTLVNSGSASLTGSVYSYTVTGLTLSAGTNYYFAVTNTNITPLPIKLIDLKAGFLGSSSLGVNWITEEDENCKGFYVFTSENGKTWSSSEFINSKSLNYNNGSSIAYSAIIKMLGLKSDIVYIKLKQIDLNGNYYWSNIISVNINNKTLNDIVQISPNPVKDILSININSINNDDINFQLFDIWGRKISNVQYINNQIDMSLLPSGLYVLKININGIELNERILK
jgi:hypothetical protein